MRHPVLVATWAMLAGCGGPPPTEETPPPPDALQVSVGLYQEQAGFQPLAQEARLILEPGAQGGFHLSLALRLGGCAAGEVVTVEREARRQSDGRLVSRGSYRAVVEDKEGGLGPRTETPLFLCPTPVGVAVDGAPLVVTTQVVSDGGARGKVETLLVASCPEGAADFCRRICSG